MAFPMDHRFLRAGNARDISVQMHQLALDNPQSRPALSQQLLQIILSESVPPMVYALWTSSCPDGSAIAAGIRQSDSIIVRSSAIRTFRRRFRTIHCAELWRELGGTDGIIRLLADFSVIHVKEFCKAVSRCGTGQLAFGVRELLVTELLQALIPGPLCRNSDKRPLLDLYARLVLACTSEMKDWWTAQPHLPSLDVTELCKADASRGQLECSQTLTSCGDEWGEQLGDFGPLFRSVPRKPGSRDPSASASMEFAVQVFELLERNGTILKSTRWLDEILQGLLKRLVRKRPSTDFTCRALSSIAYCVENRTEEPRRFYIAPVVYKDPWFFSIIRLWQRNSSAYEPHLTPLLRSYDQKTDLGDYRRRKASILGRILTSKPEQRYRLLRWILANHDRYRVDIEDGTQLRHQFKFSPELLFSLPRAEALRLFERYAAHAPGRLRFGISMDGSKISPEDDPGVKLLHLKLMKWSDSVGAEAERWTLRCREMAQQTGSQPVRSDWIRAAVFFAVTSKSRLVLRDVLIWARRYSGDPKTVIELYRSSVLREYETHDILSGIPPRSSGKLSLSSVNEHVREGNEIIMVLLETAILSQKEPSFCADNWSGVKAVFHEVVRFRLRRVDALYSSSNSTNNEIFSQVIEDTLDLLVKAERLSLDEGNSGLQFDNMHGFLKQGPETRVDGPSRKGLCLRNPSLATLRFIDELAKRRENLWLSHRPKAHPAVLTLERPWPRGLPIQALSCLRKDACMPKGSLPFLEKRAEDVVFFEKESALSPIPENGQVQAAIGPFVDNYIHALQMYISWCGKDERERRIEATWHHATRVLTGDRLSMLESKQYWKDPFSEAGAPPTAFMLNYPSQNDPVLPVEDAQSPGPAEWNPSSNKVFANVTKRSLEPLVIDCLTHSSKPSYLMQHSEIGEAFIRPEHVLEPMEVPGFWDLKKYGDKSSRVPAKAREAFIAAALLYVDGQAQARSKVLSLPFPSPTSPRFPPLYFDTELLDSNGPDDKGIQAMLNRFLPAIPPILLERLARSLVKRFNAEDKSLSARRTWIGTVLGLLAQSDKPQLATDLLVRAILDYPGESSWHRVLLRASIFNRLTPSQARAMLLRLSDGIGEALAQSAGSIGHYGALEAPGPYSSSRPNVKVTTIRLLVHLIKDSAFVDEDFIVQMLVSLLSRATHIGLRAIIVEALEGILFKSGREETREAIINALIDLAVPVAADLNERSPMSEQRWRDAEQACEPPEITQTRGFSPICGALVGMVGRAKDTPGAPQNLVERILIPILVKSRENNARWNRIFLRKHGMVHLEHEIPERPHLFDLPEILLEKHTSRMPLAEFEKFSEMILGSSQISQELRGFLEHLDNDPAIHRPNDVSYWLRACQRFEIRPNTVGYSRTAKVLTTAEFAPTGQLDEPTVVTPAHLQGHERKVLDFCIDKYPSTARQWSIYVGTYNPPLRDATEKVKLRWREYVRPLVQYAVAQAEARRTEAWASASQHRQKLLPDTFSLQLWLLTYPSLAPPHEQTERLECFATEVYGIIRRLAQSGRPYHAQWPLLQNAVKECDPQDWTTLALWLGTDDSCAESSRLTLATLLSVELADVLLATAKPKDKETATAIWKMLDRWARSRDEEVRRRGIETHRKLEKMGWKFPENS